MMRILISCGIGDFIGIESYMRHDEREAVVAIHWATRQREGLQEIVPFAFPNLREHVIERDTWGAPFTDDFCVSSRDQLPNLPPEVLDWSVRACCDEIRGGRTFYGSTFVKRTLCDITYLQLPPRYFVVHPYSENARTPERDLNPEEWLAVQRHVARLRLPLVIINKGDERMRQQHEALDLTGKLTLLEAIEVTKGAAGFVGCSSLFAAIAAKFLPAEYLFIKSNRSVKMHFYWLYYAPQESNSFVTDDLLKIIPRA